jgi:hypothetical protein
MPPNYRKRRIAAHINKNELKISRNEAEKKSIESAGTLRNRFPQVQKLQISQRMESVSGAVLEETIKEVGLDESLILNVPCQGGCSGGVFLLTDAVIAAITSGQEQRDGMGLCQMSSYRDPTLPCSTKFYYRVILQY